MSVSLKLFEKYEQAVIGLTLDHMQAVRELKKKFLDQVDIDIVSSSSEPELIEISSPSIEKSKVIRKLNFEEEEKEERSSSSSFIADSDEEPIVYTQKQMDDALAEYLPKSGQKRSRNLAQRWSPSQHVNDRPGVGIALHGSPASKADLKEYAEFCEFVSDSGFVDASESSAWFMHRYTRQLKGIIDNLGREGKNAEPKRIFNLIMSGKDASLQKKRQGGPGEKICILCNIKKNCPNTLWIEEEDGYTYSYPIANNCARVAQAAISFVKAIIQNEPLEKVDAFFADLQDAHAGKGKEEK